MKSEVLQKKVMLVKASMSQWTGRRKDKVASEKVAADFGSDRNMGHYVKQAIAKEHLNRITKNINEFRTLVYKYTLPWQDDGFRLLSVELYQKLSEETRKHSTEHNEAVDEFIQNYSRYIHESENRLNGLFNPADYPTAQKLYNKFSFDVTFSPVPDSGSFALLSDMVDTEIVELSEALNEQHSKALETAMADCWERIHDLIVRLRDKMTEQDRPDKKGNLVSPIFRDSIIGNIKELVDILPGLNITKDPALEKARQDLEADLARINPQELRESKESRQEVAKKTDTILNNLAGYMQPAV